MCSEGICDSSLHIYSTLLFRKFGSEATTKATPFKHVIFYISLYQKLYIMTLEMYYWIFIAQTPFKKIPSGDLDVSLALGSRVLFARS